MKLFCQSDFQNISNITNIVTAVVVSAIIVVGFYGVVIDVVAAIVVDVVVVGFDAAVVFDSVVDVVKYKLDFPYSVSSKSNYSQNSPIIYGSFHQLVLTFVSSLLFCFS